MVASILRNNIWIRTVFGLLVCQRTCWRVQSFSFSSLALPQSNFVDCCFPPISYLRAVLSNVFLKLLCLPSGPSPSWNRSGAPILEILRRLWRTDLWYFFWRADSPIINCPLLQICSGPAPVSSFLCLVDINLCRSSLLSFPGFVSWCTFLLYYF